jgi:hypothetical protein
VYLVFVSVRCILIDLSGHHVIDPCYLLPEDDQRTIELNDAVLASSFEFGHRAEPRDIDRNMA